MKQFSKILAILVGLFVALPVWAQAPENEMRADMFAVEGVGRLTCATYMDVRDDKRSPQFQRLIGFVEGYLSAANKYEPDTFDLTPWHNATAFDLIIEHHCAEHPSETLVTVVQRMVSGFKPIRVAKPSSMLEVGDGNHRAYVYEAVLRRTQAALKQRGFYSGDEDGRYSEELRNSLRQFQQMAKLNETGVPDPATLWTLLNP